MCLDLTLTKDKFLIANHGCHLDQIEIQFRVKRSQFWVHLKVFQRGLACVGPTDGLRSNLYFGSVIQNTGRLNGVKEKEKACQYVQAPFFPSECVCYCCHHTWTLVSSFVKVSKRTHNSNSFPGSFQVFNLILDYVIVTLCCDSFNLD